MKVLIIDNSSLFHEMLEDIFSASDATALICDTAGQGMEKLKSQHFDFICVSMYLEDGDGISLTKTIRNTTAYKHIPIILFTSEESDDLYVDALSSGVTEVFHKKDVQQLINFINHFALQQQPISGRVLYVEDVSSQRQLITELFTKRGLVVDAFAAAEQAWQSYLQHDYDLVVTDIVLEGSMTGMALTNRIRRLDNEKGDVPILAITGFDDISRRIELFYLGVSDYVIKPLIEEELIARVRNLIQAKQFYMESVRQRQRAEAADNAKSEFLSRMSHELRTPLNAILGFSQLIMTDPEYPLAPIQQDSMTSIRQAGSHLLNLINDILDISKIEAGEVTFDIKEARLDDIVDNAVKQVMPTIEEHDIEFLAYSIPSELKVKVDVTRLHQVMLNLLSNAIKYNSEHGKIQILCKPLDDKFVLVGIKDTGFGLTEQQQAQLFTPFSRVGQNAGIEGTGLGLVICRQLMNAMGGQIDLKSKQDQGSVFWLKIPKA
ncbi:MAG: response regulator [Gammaproteobacteria bacterium]|nr:response regulator [Gammaproteobacteria bacterium]